MSILLGILSQAKMYNMQGPVRMFYEISFELTLSFMFNFRIVILNPFLTIALILYPLKATEKLWFSGVFRGYIIGTLARNGLIALVFRTVQFNSKQTF